MQLALARRAFRIATFCAVALTILVPRPAQSVQFTYQVDRFELDGNVVGAPDGVADLVDEFDDGVLFPGWGILGTVFESGGLAFLTDPGVMLPGPDGLLHELSIAAGRTYVAEGQGDFTGTSYWEPIIPGLDEHYHFSLFTFDQDSPVQFSETFGLGIGHDDSGLHIEQHLTELDQVNGIYQNTMIDYFSILESDVTGQIVFRLEFDDATNLATSSFSLDGGATWQSPFPPAEIFVGRPEAQFLLSADPIVTATTTTTSTTTTTTASTTSTTTTLLPGACVAVGCKTAVQPFKGRLIMQDRAGDAKDFIFWRLRGAEATDPAEFGDPLTTTSGTSYDLCIGDGAGVTLLEVSVAPGGQCGSKPCWKVIGSGKGYRYRDPAAGQGGASLLKLKGRLDADKTAILFRARGGELPMPALPLTLPVTVRLENSDGACWAETFTEAGVSRNTSTHFGAR